MNYRYQSSKKDLLEVVVEEAEVFYVNWPASIIGFTCEEKAVEKRQDLILEGDVIQIALKRHKKLLTSKITGKAKVLLRAIKNGQIYVASLAEDETMTLIDTSRVLFYSAGIRINPSLKVNLATLANGELMVASVVKGPGIVGFSVEGELCTVEVGPQEFIYVDLDHLVSYKTTTPTENRPVVCTYGNDLAQQTMSKQAYFVGPTEIAITSQCLPAQMEPASPTRRALDTVKNMIPFPFS